MGKVEDVMISPRTLAALSGCLALLSVSAMAQPAADGAPLKPQAAPAAAAPSRKPDAPRPARAETGHAVRPASAVPPERIQVEPAPGARPVLPPQDDPRSVEEDKGEPDAIDQ
jgi:hypothetical protein